MSDHEDRIHFLREYLKGWIQLEGMTDRRSGLTTMATYLLENGEGFQGRRKPREYRFDEIKGCFGNAARLALEGLTYYEGYVFVVAYAARARLERR